MPIRLALYNYTGYNPLTFIDPDGLFEVFASTGQFLFKDDNSEDQNVYVMHFGETGITTYNTQMTTGEFHEVAATIYGEASGEAPIEETLGISHVIKTRSDKSGKSLKEEVMKPKQFEGRTNVAANNYRKGGKYSEGPKGKANRVRAGLIGAQFNVKDPTGGATNFEGAGLYGTDKSSFKENVEKGKLQRIKQIGGTIFFKPLPKTKTDK